PFPAAILLELVAFLIFLALIVSLASSFPELSMFPLEILPIAVTPKRQLLQPRCCSGSYSEEVYLRTHVD
ncbi:MAG: hypothetical protein ACFNLG_06090, partial [Prevotella nigrescens]|uniref:hypothetical protein n=1 Tax=Prevotella nigrescens TaxID=28133 RepID=UPI00361246F4